jgi:hypothetical protein
MSTTLLTKVKRLQDQLQRREDRYPGERTSCRDIAKRLGQMVAAEEARMKREEWPRSKPLTGEENDPDAYAEGRIPGTNWSIF